MTSRRVSLCALTVHRRGGKTNVFLPPRGGHDRCLWRGTWRERTFLSDVFLAQRDRLKVVVGHVAMAMTPEHPASSSSRPVKCEIGLPEGFSVLPEDFESYQRALARGKLARHCLLPFHYSSISFFCIPCFTARYYSPPAASRCFEKCLELQLRAAHPGADTKPRKAPRVEAITHAVTHVPSLSSRCFILR